MMMPTECRQCHTNLLDPDEIVVRAQEIVTVKLAGDPHPSQAMTAGIHYFHVACFTPSPKWMERGRVPLGSFVR